ncbi:MAG: SUMF1/EgtB/PvdO family nonheme iron enzyme [Myxococcota bacterium]
MRVRGVVGLVLLGILASSCRREVSPAAPTVSVPAGTFQLGCNRARDPSCSDTELPSHDVTLPAFTIDRTEVTQGAYAACVTARRCTPPRCEYTPETTPRRPVVCVSWEQADAFCAWSGKRLPTEAEWERAARGTDGRVYPWGDEAPTCELAVYPACQATLLDVGSRPRGISPSGALDMAGSVDEWVADWFGPYPSEAQRAPTGPTQGMGRLARGGAYDAWHMRSTARSALDPAHTDHLLGFRCAR